MAGYKNDIYGIKQKDRMDRYHHSAAYHRYFAGYTEVRNEDEKGRIAIQRIYTDPWIRPRVSRGVFRAAGLLYLVFFVLGMGMSITALSADVASNYMAFLELLVLAGMASGLLLGYSILRFLFVPYKMTRWQHSSTSHYVLCFSGVLGVSSLLGVLAKGGYMAVSGNRNRGEVRSTLYLLVGALSFFCILYLEKRMKYDKVENNRELPPGETYRIG